jgi:5-(carboxyamino)imidazole ribonucleotide synthase
VLDPAAHSPAGSVADERIVADYLDDQALEQLLSQCVGVTTEFENVPALALETLEQHIRVSPSSFSVGVAQNRVEEKRYIASCGVPVAPYLPILGMADIGPACERLLPGILKTARFGYDGKGQMSVGTLQELSTAYQELGAVACVLEKRLGLQHELSVIVARHHTGQCVTYPVAENHHHRGILDLSVVPARITPLLAQAAKAHAIAVANALDYIGVLCVEFFVVDGQALVVNEIAPRPHNSGHYSIDACVTCQFEQQARILAGLPLGSPVQHSCAVMLNLLGDLWFDADGHEREPNWAGVLALPEVKLHLYGKEQARVGRKMGHITVVAPHLNMAVQRAAQVRALLRMAPSAALGFELSMAQ